MSAPTSTQIIERATAIWRRSHPRANDSTYTATMAIARLFSAARRELRAEGGE